MKQRNNKTKLFLLFITISVLLSCEDKNYYEPGRQNENPLEVTVPDGFEWKTTRSVNVKVEAKDEFDGQYHYLIEIFNENPVIDDSAKQITNGVSKTGQPFTTRIALPLHVDGVYIKQTSPTGLVSVHYANVVNGSINCDINSATAPTSRAVTTRAGKNIQEPEITTDIFPAAAPPNAIPLTNNWVPGGSANAHKLFIINTNFTNVNVGSYASFYITEDVKITNLSGQSSWHIYILPGKKLTIKNSYFNFEQQGGRISVGEGAELIVNGMSISNNVKVYNRGTIKSSGRISASANALLYNDGTLRATGIVEMRSNGNVLYNNGDMTCTDFGSTGGASTQNNGTVVVENDCRFDSNELWINNGSWKTKTMKATGSRMEYYNNCRLIVTDLMSCQGSDFYNNGGAYVYAENFKSHSSRIHMGSGAFFHVNTLATFDWHNQTDGFTGPDSGGMALLKMKKADVTGAIHYRGRLEVACSDHTKETVGYKKWTMTPPAQWAPEGEGKNTVEIPKTTCNEGSVVNPDGEEDKKPQPITDPFFYSFLFEDLWPFYGDYDMNDAVILVDKITKNRNTEGAVTSFTFDYSLKAVGAGGSLGCAVMLDAIEASSVSGVTYSSAPPTGFETTGAGIESGQGKAVIPLFANAHNFLGKRPGQFINTVKESLSNVSNVPTVTVTVNFASPVPDNFDATTLNMFIIPTSAGTLTGTNRKEIHLLGYSPSDKANTSLFGNNDDRSTKGKTYVSRDNLSWAIMVPDKFRWPIEYKNIRLAYTGFANWVQTGGAENQDWWKTPADDDLVY